MVKQPPLTHTSNVLFLQGKKEEEEKKKKKKKKFSNTTAENNLSIFMREHSTCDEQGVLSINLNSEPGRASWWLRG